MNKNLKILSLFLLAATNLAAFDLPDASYEVEAEAVATGAANFDPADSGAAKKLDSQPHTRVVVTFYSGRSKKVPQTPTSFIVELFLGAT